MLNGNVKLNNVKSAFKTGIIKYSGVCEQLHFSL